VKVLVLTSRLPYPPFRGDKLKIYNLIRQLSRNHDIALVSFIQRRSEERWIPELKNYCRSVEVVHLSRAASLWNCIKAIPRAIPFQVAYFESPAMVPSTQRTILARAACLISRMRYLCTLIAL
jgi:hypothetical protein